MRLLKGDFERETRYPVEPAALATHYRGLGAQWLHVVDLDGAATGEPANLDVVERLREVSSLRIQFGGGIRLRGTLEHVLGRVDRAVIGSLAVTEPSRVTGWLEEFGAERLTLALDVRVAADGTPFVSTHGWTRGSALTLDEAIEQYRPAGLRHVLCTDIDRDGALSGPNVELYRACAAKWPELKFQASGGVRDAADLEALAAAGVAAAISGKALLEGKIDDQELRAFLPGA